MRTSFTFADLGGPPKPWLVVFDLDGTLIDSSLDLCHAVNAALEHVDRPQLSHALISSYIGDGAATLVRRALENRDLDESQVLDRSQVSDHGISHDQAFNQTFEATFDFFLEFYREHKLDNTRAYNGVLDALHSLRTLQPHLPMAVLTNKPVNPSRDICEALHLAPFFFANYGGNSFQTKKPHPQGLQHLMAEARQLWGRLGVDDGQLTSKGVILVGDSDVDVLTARQAGARSLGCRYGLAPQALQLAGPDLMVDSPGDWPAALGL